MDLISILDTHTVMQQWTSDPDVVSPAAVNINVTSDLQQYADDLMWIVAPFSFDEVPIIDDTNDHAIMCLNLYWDEDFTYNSATYSSFGCYLVLDYPMTSDKITVHLKWKPGGGSYEYGSTVDLDPNLTYAVVLQLINYSTTKMVRAWIYEIDTYGKFTSVTSTLSSYAITQIDTNSHETLYMMRQYAYQIDNIDIKLKLYEPDLRITKSELNYRLFVPTLRMLDFAYYSNYQVHNFVFPPLAAFNGCAYDRTEILETQITNLETLIDALEVDIITLQSDLDDANAIIVDLQEDVVDELSSGNFWINALGLVKTYLHANPIFEITEAP